MRVKLSLMRSSVSGMEKVLVCMQLGSVWHEGSCCLGLYPHNVGFGPAALRFKTTFEKFTMELSQVPHD